LVIKAVYIPKLPSKWDKTPIFYRGNPLTDRFTALLIIKFILNWIFREKFHKKQT